MIIYLRYGGKCNDYGKLINHILINEEDVILRALRRVEIS